MKRLLLLPIFTFCFANDYTSLLQEAKELEASKDYKAAMLLYKKIAQENIDKELTKSVDNTIINKDSENVIEFNNSIEYSKKEFFDTNIEKTDDKDTNRSLEQLVTKDFGIYPYKKNYILPASYTFNNDPSRNKFETAFQLSFEKPISHNFFGLNETISLAYTQKSFWQTAANSAPFRESNYQPEAFIQIPYEKGNFLKLYKIGFNHFSNGKSAENSRSLNRVYLQGTFQFENLFVIPKVWYRIPEDSKSDENRDFYNYYGYGDLNFLYAYKKHTFELLLRDNLKLNNKNKGAIEFNWSFPLPHFMASKNTYGLFQIFHGYGQSLIDYDKEITNVGIGLTFSR